MNPCFPRSRRALADAIVVLLLAAVPLVGQGQSPASTAKAPAKPWTLSRTPDGQPDLQGIWTNATTTPLERPAALAGKEFFTEQELAENEKALQQPRTRESAGTAAHYDF